MLNKEQYKKLYNLIIRAYKTDVRSFVKLNFDEPNVDTAMAITKKIKFYEKSDELKNAKKDLEEIFGISTKKMTKNVIYLKHQSSLANSIYYHFLMNREPVNE